MNADKDAYIKQTITQLPRLFEFYEGTNEPYLGLERNIQKNQSQLLKLCIDLVSHQYAPPFYEKRRYKQPCADASPLGIQILNCLVMVDTESLGEASWGASSKTFSPDIEIVVSIMRAALAKEGRFVGNVGFVPPLPVFPDQYRMQTPHEVQAAVDSMNELACILRKALLKPEVRAQIKSFRRNSTKRYQQAMFVTHQAFNNHRKILLIRLDWSFKKRYPAVLTSQISETEFAAQLEDVTAYRKIMLKILRNMFGKDLAFYVSKIECGEIKGLHIHWLIGINGTAHQDRINVPRRIAEAWDSSIGRSDAYTFNVNAKFGAERSGLRVIKYHDPELGEILGRYCDYLTKVDYCMKLRLPNHMHSFACSKRQERRFKKRGPTRKYTAMLIDPASVRGPQGGVQHKHRTGGCHA